MHINNKGYTQTVIIKYVLFNFYLFYGFFMLFLAEMFFASVDALPQDTPQEHLEYVPISTVFSNI